MSLSKDPFKIFLESWVEELNTIITQLESVPLTPIHETEHKDLISAFMEHQECLFSAKRTLVGRDPFISICLPWINSLSRALQWFGGWRPVAAYRIAEFSQIIPQEHEATVEAMRLVTEVEEAAIEKEKSQAENKVIRAFVSGKGITSMEMAFKATMERVALATDMTRMEAVKRVISIIEPVKAIVYLAELGKMEADFYAMNEVQV